MGNLTSWKTWDLRQRNYSLVIQCAMRTNNFSIDAGSWGDGTYYIQPGSSATASI